MGKMFLLIIDAHFKWMDIHCVNSATSSVTIDKMRSTFASHGLPEIVVSDNGSNFVSSEFKSFLLKNGIKLITSAPYHPSTNGLVERAVQTFKQGMKKQGDSSVDRTHHNGNSGWKIVPRYKDTKNMHALTASDLHVSRMKKYATKQDDNDNVQ